MNAATARHFSHGRLLALMALALLWAGCGREAELSPEARIRELLAVAERAVEDRDLSAAAALISDSYHDKQGRGYRELRSLLAGYFLRHQSIHLLTKLEDLNLPDERHARLVLYAGVAGARNPSIDSLSEWSGNLIRLELELNLEADDAWRLRSAQWRRARRGDLIQ